MTAVALTQERRRAKRRAAWRRRRLVLLLMSPWIVGFGVFFAYPLISNAYLSFTHYDLLSHPRWIGTSNYKFLFEKDPSIWPAVKNTLWLAVNRSLMQPTGASHAKVSIRPRCATSTKRQG